MRKFYLFLSKLVIFCCPFLINAQECKEWRIVDEHQTEIKLIKPEVKNYLDSLTNIGYYTLNINYSNQDSCFIKIEKGKQFKKIFVETKDESLLSHLKFDSIHQHHYTDTFDLMIQNIKDSLAIIGHHFDVISIQPQGYFGDFALTEINIEQSFQRKIDDIKFIGYENVPKFVRRELLKNDLIYNQKNMEVIRSHLNDYNFINQIESPKISFTQDSTILYVYTQKVKQSFVNGIIGFETDENNKLNLQGNVQLHLLNTFNGNERIRLDWKSGLNKSQNLNFEIFLPYIFNINLALETQLNLIKQDSTFFKLEWRNAVLYPITPNHYIGANFNLANSNFINQNKDFSKNGFGISYSYQNSRVHRLQENKSSIHFTSTLWKRKLSELESEKTDQTEVIYWVERQQRIYKNHYFNAAFHGRNLIQKAEVLENDLYQIGGFNTLRGFNQNSILTPAYNTLSLAYRYIPNNRIYFEIFSDLALVQSKNAEETSFFNAYGLGMQFATNFGWFHLSYALGAQEESSANFSDGKIHIGIKSYF